MEYLQKEREIRRMVTVVIPVYNNIKTLKKCVDSVLSQTYSELDIILVDSESTDSSADLCDRYSQAEPRVSVYHIKDEGVSNARNYGIEKAKGEYISFIDADDYILPEYIEELVSVIEKEDALIAMCDAYDVDGDIVLKRKAVKKINPFAKDFILDTFYGRTQGGTCWGKLFRTSEIKNAFRRYNYCEDTFFIFDYLNGYEGRIAVVRKYLYYYVRRKDSITGLKRAADLSDGITACNEIRNLCRDKFPEYSGAADAFLLNNAFFVYLNIKNNPSPEDTLLGDRALNIIKKYRAGVLSDFRATVRTKAACLVSVLSVKLLKRLYAGRKHKSDSSAE